jgi:hypothetical protein
MTIVNPAKSLFAKESCYIKGGGYLIPFDVITSERHRMESALATHAVDGDTEITTHIHNKLRTGEFEGIVSNWSVNRPLFISTAINGNGLSFGTGMELNQAKTTYTALRALHEVKALVEIILGLQTYKNMVITSVEAGRTKDSGDAQSFSIRFQQVKIVTLKKTQLTAKTYNTTARDADFQASTGRQTGKTL